MFAQMTYYAYIITHAFGVFDFDDSEALHSGNDALASSNRIYLGSTALHIITVSR